jgi:peptide-methionine (S)-S-oxide reductase
MAFYDYKQPVLAMATFAAGSFWEAEAHFGALEGVVRTRIGYAGGETRRPSYLAPGDHTEAVQVTFQPDLISYTKLLQVFWENHNAAIHAHTRRFASVIYYHDGLQRAAALASKYDEQERRRTVIFTEVLPFTTFYQAEDHYQKYYLNRFPELIVALSAIRADPQPLINSTAVARVNGYLAGFGSPEDIERNMVIYQVTPEWRETIMKIGGIGRKEPTIVG